MYLGGGGFSGMHLSAFYYSDKFSSYTVLLRGQLYSQGPYLVLNRIEVQVEPFTHFGKKVILILWFLWLVCIERNRLQPLFIIHI
jgi:hypothetical protein